MEGKSEEEVSPKKCHTALFEGSPQLLISLTFTGHVMAYARSSRPCIAVAQATAKLLTPEISQAGSPTVWGLHPLPYNKC
jgi:hypothetical protein